MRLAKKLLLTFIITVSALPAGLLLAAVLLVAEPQWFLTTGTVGRAVNVFGGAYHPRWKRLTFGISSLSLREKQIELRAQDFCFEGPALGLEGCVKELDLQFNVRLYAFGFKLTKVQRLIVSGDHLRLDRTRVRAVAAGKGAGLPTSLPGLLPPSMRGCTLGRLELDLPANTIVSAGGTLRGRLRVNLGDKAGPLTIKAEIDSSSGAVKRHYRGEGTLDSDILRGGALTFLDARGSLKAEGVKALFSSRVEQTSPGVLAFSLATSARMPGRRLEADLKGSKKGPEIVAGGSAGVWESTGPVNSVQLKRCALAVRLKTGSTEWDTFSFSGFFEVDPEPFGLKKSGLNLQNKIEGRLAVRARSTPGLLAKDHFDGEVSLTVEPGKDWYQAYGLLDAKVSGRASRLSGLEISHKLDLTLKVARFPDLVEFLAHTPYSVPAPLNVLQGPLVISLKGAGDPRKAEQELDYEIVSGLAAGRQALKFKVKGKLAAKELWKPGRSFTDETEMLIEDIALQLPRLDLKGMASFTPDSRIKTGAVSAAEEKARQEQSKLPAAGTGAALQGKIHIKTAKPVILYSNMARDPVPVGLDLTIGFPAGSMAGVVEVKAFRANIFRRIAAIDHIRLTGRAGSPLMDLDGLIVYKAAEARIFIRLLGSAQKPQVKFESDPARSQADIMAMLLFGKSPSELDSDQESSAANAQTAVANSAFGLASLYLLASTPVEYVGYDPVSRAYTVKLKLPGGATLQVGSDGQGGGVQLRKRIASNLAIQTELTNTQTQGNVVTTLLEWYGRR